MTTRRGGIFPGAPHPEPKPDNMSSCSATGSNASAANRVYAWNVVFLDSDDAEFAGVYQQDGFLTFADVFRELRLCFDFPGPGTLSIWSNDGDNFDGIVPVHEDDVEGNTLFIPTDASGARTPLRLALHVRQDCAVPLSSTSPLEDHLRGQCARKVQPKKRFKRPYLGINERATDLPPSLPFRGGSRSGSQSPRKRPRSGSQSPTKSTSAALVDIAEEDAASGTTRGSALDSPELRLLMQQFRATACSRNDRCAVTGLGRAWTRAGGLGPGVQACHIVPQLQYNLYPDRWPPSFSDSDLQPEPVVSASSRDRLEKSWKNTWAGGNSLLLLRHLHDLFDARFFSIHPDTKRIRVFIPYDVLMPYQGKLAQFDSRGVPDKRALGQHWDICCMENMLAASPSVPLPSLSTLPTPVFTPGWGHGTTFQQLGCREHEHEPNKSDHHLAASGGGGDEPSQRGGGTQKSLDMAGPGDNQTPPQLTHSHSFQSEQRETEETEDQAGGSERPAKRQRRSHVGTGEPEDGRDEERDRDGDEPGGPPVNRASNLKQDRDFLADVDWALDQWKAAGIY